MRENLFDLEFYRIHRQTIESWFRLRDRSSPEHVERWISEYAIVCGCHIVATMTFYMEIFGEEEWLKNKRDFLLNWYKFTGIASPEKSQK